MKTSPLTSATLVSVLLVLSAGSVRAHSVSYLRAIIGSAGPGKIGHFPSVAVHDGTVIPNSQLQCGSGMTVHLSAVDAAQAPACVACGSALQLCCGGTGCAAGLQCIHNNNLQQPVCVAAAGFKPREVKRTAKGKVQKLRQTKGLEATVTLTQQTGCGMPGWACCANQSCDPGSHCEGATCIPTR